MRNQQAIERVLGEPLASVESVRGGDINEAYRLRTASGRRAFAKTHRTPPPGMYKAEARGLVTLRDADTGLRVPEVIAVDERWLILADLGKGKRTADFDRRLGRGLAALHRPRSGRPGLDHSNYVGSIPQDNTPTLRGPAERSAHEDWATAHEDWATFYEHRRLRPLVKRARLDAELGQDFDALYERLPELVEGAELSLLHGDLWGGNVHADEAGSPCLIDPAVYVGDREVDLAMMQLFGGFGSAVYEAYDESFQRREGHEDRLALYQLYPLLVHVSLFGQSYLGAVRRALSQYV